MSEIQLHLEEVDPRELYGQNNVRLKLLKEAFPELRITSRGNQIKIAGPKKDAQKAKSKVEMMVRYLKKNNELTDDAVIQMLNGNSGGAAEVFSFSDSATIVHGRTGKPIKARTRNQRRMVEAMDRHDVLFAVGPAGTGKTYTAVALAVRALKNRWVKKIILTRPAVEAGESLGFLPGDLKEKVDPYLRPLYDALDDMFPPEKLNYFMNNRIIEVAPLAFMRGRTLDDAFIILDEAQNATTMQIKMFLTRLGPSAKAIINGDLSQIDLPYSQKSGLRKAVNLLGNLDGISTVVLDKDDVVRHRLVKQIIGAYDRDAEMRRHGRGAEEE